MSKNVDIGTGRQMDDSDLVFSTSNSAKVTNDSAERQKKAQMIARQIAENIGDNSGYDSDTQNGYDSYDDVSSEKAQKSRVYNEDVTRERTMPTRKVSSAQRNGQRTQRNVSSSGNRNGSQQRRSSQNSQRRNNSSYSSSRPPQRKRKKKKQSSGAGVAIGFLLGFIVLLVGMGYFIGLIMTNGAFLPNTTINGVDVSKMTLAEATEALKSDVSNNNIEITKSDGSVILIPYADFDYGDDMETKIQQAYSSINRKTWFKSLFSTNEITIKPEISYNEAKLSVLFDNVVWGTVEPQNAYIKRGDDGRFFIVDATKGDKVNYEILKPYLIEQVRNGNMKINITNCDCFYEAEIQREDLEEKLPYYEAVGNIDIIIDFDYTQEELTLDDFSTWLTFDSNGSYTVNRDSVAQYVGYLADTYDTYGTSRKFHATLQGDIYVEQGPQGTYGWKIDQEKTTDKIYEMLSNGESATIDPIYATRLDDYGNPFFWYKAIEKDRSAESDIGNTYIEVDLTAQHMWYYENGELKFETDQIVTGLASKEDRITPEGVYEVLDKKSPAKLSGDGYSNVKVSYFIRVSYEGIGFHDLSRSSYGGQIYLTNGSHGCINMKKAEVTELYGMVKGGTAVVMYY